MNENVSGQAEHQKIAEQLAVFIGPIAPFIVERAASKCSTVDELYAAVAEEIASAKDRERFLAARLPR